MLRSVTELRQIATDACLACGASEDMAKSLVEATVAAAFVGRREVGFAHFLDYLRSLRDGRIAAQARPHFNSSYPAVIIADACGGIAQLGFDLAFDDLVKRTREFGLAIFTQRNSYTSGELGYYVRRLAQAGLVSIANANAVMATAERGERTFSTSPIAFGAPLPPPHAPLVIDQASSATAFVSIAHAAARGQPIPEGWAIDQAGNITTDPSLALLGALLPFGGYKGANIALLVEVLSAGVSGANWSVDAGDFRSGTKGPGIGLTIVAILPTVADPSFEQRTGKHLDRLRALGVYIPGSNAPRERCQEGDLIEIDDDIFAEIRQYRDCVTSRQDSASS